MQATMKIVRLMGPAGRAARIFQEWMENEAIIALPNLREVHMTPEGPKELKNCAVFPAEVAERVAAEFNAWMAGRMYVTVVNTVRTQREWRMGLPGSQKKEIKMFVGPGHGITAFTQNWK